MTKDIDPAVLQAMFAGLCAMKSNLNTKRRLDEDAT
jgi:hypothetical protein